MNIHLKLLPIILVSVQIAGGPGSRPQASSSPPPFAALPASGGSAQKAPSVTVGTDYGRMALQFIANRGQVDPVVEYYVPGRDKTIYFSADGLTLTLGDGAERWAVKIDFVGANPGALPRGEARGEAVVSYFKGRPADWRTDIPTYTRLVYPDLWPGIDLVYSGTYERLKYEFIVRPGADPAAIRLAYRGVDALTLGSDGRLLVKTPAGSFSDDAPFAYQEIGGRRDEIGLSYALADCLSGGEAEESADKAYGFKVGAYDRDETLVIDPAVLVYCGLVGGTGTESGTGMAVDAAGCAYVTGTTSSTETSFPVAAGPDLTFDTGLDAFVAKVKADGTGLVYCGFIGGAGADYANGIAVDAAGCAYVAGTTDSGDATFPVVVGPDLVYGAHPGTGGYPDAFIAKVNASGTALAYCGYIGGRDEDRGNAVAVDGAGCAYVTGFTTNDESPELYFPVLVGPDLTHNGIVDAFVTKVSADGTGYAYSGFIGGNGSDYGHGIAVDGSGRACVAGVVYSDQTTFPVLGGPDLTFNGGNCDAFVARVGASGSGLDYCGFIGGSEQDIAYGVAVDADGCAYVAGQTYSTETSFPVTIGPDLSANGLDDAFVAKVSDSGAGFDYCGFIGGSASDQAWGIAVDAKGNAYLTGEARSSESTFPVVSGPDLTHNGTFSDDAFIAKVRPGGYGIEYCGYLGGTNHDSGKGVAVDAAGNAYVTGVASYATSPPFPTTGGPDLSFNGGPDDAFVAKIQYFDENISKHAVGDFDGDGRDEAALDFGTNGVWVWKWSSLGGAMGVWGQVLAADPENLLAANIDGTSSDRIVADLGTNGLWLWNGAWTGISNSNPETIVPADVDADGAEELAVDFGATGLWLWNGGSWFSLSGLNAEGAAALDADGNGGEELAVDFGQAGLWLWNGGAWSQISGLNSNQLSSGNLDGSGTEDLAAAFGSVGVWLWSGGAWTQISGARPDYLIAANVDGVGGDEVVGDFGTIGLWMWSAGAWTQLSGVNADYLISADTDGDGAAEVFADFGAIGLWLWNAGTWTQLSGVNPEYLFVLDYEPEGLKEIMADFGMLGLWLWDEGAWSQLSALNPD